ncbi:uroporphyrinogen decarboxylase family protein, partial [Mesorhizobium japonicum]|uniref:uroporphyrinogen decarboxylase family protein n=1 Tax=Mesorhizobium japonicum TaxID=2066070 RepID=UPI003B59E22A
DALRGTPVPRVHFGLGAGEVLDLLPAIGADVVGVDWRLPLDVAAERIGTPMPLQGNIDPALLSAPWEILVAHTREVLQRGDTLPAHIVNLGHGVPPETDPDVLARLVEFVHAEP